VLVNDKGDILYQQEELVNTLNLAGKANWNIHIMKRRFEK
jgi:hypothetical protein